MKKIIGILLIGFLGFLGCSDGDDGTTTVGKATPVAPFGIVEPPIHTYEWTPVSGATKYRLIVQETNREGTTMDTQGTNIIDKWHTAEEAGCASEESLCMVTPDIELHGEHEFKVQACANQECGEHSDQLPFHSTAMNEPRFTDNGDHTVTDNRTKLMWTKSTNPLSGRFNLYYSKKYMSHLDGLGGKTGWRVPAIHELRSLVDPSQKNPALPPGHPFIDVKNTGYWSVTLRDHTYLQNCFWGHAYLTYVFFDPAMVLEVCVWDEDIELYAWAVRTAN